MSYEDYMTEPVTPPEDMKLAIEVSLTQYSPSGLLGLIAEALLREIGGREKWAKRLEAELLRIGRERAEWLVGRATEEVINAGAVGLTGLTELVERAAREYMQEPVDRNGEKYSSHYGQRDAPTRMQWLAEKVVRQSMDEAFKAAEAEWKTQTTTLIREMVTTVMTEKLAKALPKPEVLK